jgi:hypothetical protein
MPMEFEPSFKEQSRYFRRRPLKSTYTTELSAEK